MVFTVNGRVGLVLDGNDVGLAANFDDVGRVPAARTLRVVRVDGAPLEGRHRVFDEAALVECIGVDAHLHIVLVGDSQAVINRGRGGAPVLVQLKAQRPGLYLLG